MNYYAKITFKINGTYPMWESLSGEELTKTHEYEDLYRDKYNLYSEDYMRNLIREDLLLVAGGEDYARSISNVDIVIYPTSAETLTEYATRVNAVGVDLSSAVKWDEIDEAIGLLLLGRSK